MQKTKRKSYAQTSVISYMMKGETHADAKKRLDELWANDRHPAQLAAQKKLEEKSLKYKD